MSGHGRHERAHGGKVDANLLKLRAEGAVVLRAGKRQLVYGHDVVGLRRAVTHEIDRHARELDVALRAPVPRRLDLRLDVAVLQRRQALEVLGLLQVEVVHEEQGQREPQIADAHRDRQPHARLRQWPLEDREMRLDLPLDVRDARLELRNTVAQPTRGHRGLPVGDVVLALQAGQVLLFLRADLAQTPVELLVLGLQLPHPVELGLG